ncbi:MAG: amidohydrolase [Gemmatimonadales bacterium]|nr:MAG: amidohydrolase [Gemmatimonadales bacterium]
MLPPPTLPSVRLPAAPVVFPPAASAVLAAARGLLTGRSLAAARSPLASRFLPAARGLLAGSFSPAPCALLLALLATTPLVAQDRGDWDVNAPPFPLTDVSIDATEGTWMSLDVSPDGTEVIFDFLGDIYTIPLEGGEARALTREFAWNMQPRYSPDGRWIAFTSDRSGGDNIWVMDRDGSNLQQVTDESFRLLNGPAWSPDSQYIVARKHFTGTRSLGSGEMWKYHRTGGTGIRLTERPNDQQDVNEPAFSPDGRHLWFSQDLTPGPTFEYNKDPNAGIYGIRRLDLESGALQTVVAGPGGAARPTPSPDGRYLAFVRRVNYETHLFLRDLETGEEWSVFDGLERDMQEIWAIHGVYPTMAWTPDGAHLVFWAGGGIHRLELATGEHRPIPFRVQTIRQVASTVRHPVEVHPEAFDVRMMRHVRVSPDGGQVAYSAMGQLWVLDLDEGEPRRVTSQEEHQEFQPSWSPDGSQLAYIGWDDHELSTVRVVDVPGPGASPPAEGQAVSTRPGHHVEPVFSPDGAHIVYRRIAGGGIVSPLHSSDTGIWQVPAGGGDPLLLSESGRDPHFGADPDRVFFHDTDGGQQALMSISLEGRDQRVHLRSQWASSWRVSPDGEHVAFTERFQAFVRPFPRTGSPVDVGAGSRDLPQQRVSRDVGAWLHWSGDGSTLHWAQGPELFSLPVESVFPHLGSGDDDVELPLAEGLALEHRVQADRPSGQVAFTGGRIITMDGDQVIEDGTLVVEGNRIAAVGPSDQVDVPGGAHRVDATGMTLMPGIVDVHWHGSQGWQGIVPRQNPMNHVSLAFGVTTIHDPSTNTEEFFTAAERVRAGLSTGPRLFSTGQILYGATTPFTAEVNSLDDAREHVRRLAAQGAISVKSYNQPRRDQRQQLIQATREEGLQNVPEGGATFMHNLTMVVDGHTGVEHALSVETVYDDVLQLWAATEVGYTPTLVVAYGGLWGEEYWYSNTNVWENERLLDFNPPGVVEARSRRALRVPDEEWNHIRVASHAHRMYQEGIGVQLGAHGQQQGLDAHWELWSFGQGGMPAHDALRVATLEGARYLGMDEHIGSLEVGKLADLIVLEENPLDDLRNSDSVRWTMVNGRLYDARTLDQAGNHPQPRQPWFWERPRDR